VTITARLTLYQAILSRRSIRRYNREPLDQATLAQVRGILSAGQPLVEQNQFAALLYDSPPGTDLVSTLGGYGRILNPPHYLVPYVSGQRRELEDAGYRTEQIAVRLASLGLGSCFVGALTRESEVRSSYDLPATARVAAFLTFGRPSVTFGGRGTNQLLRLAAGANRKLPVERVFFQDSFERPVAPPAPVAALIEAARRAPSAANAQPWRFLWRDGRLHLFVTKHNRRYSLGPHEEYRFHDAGAAMANITLALEALGMKGMWATDSEGGPEALSESFDLQWIATLVLENAG
jgi:nitroreductase